MNQPLKEIKTMLAQLRLSGTREAIDSFMNEELAALQFTHQQRNL